MKSSRYVLLTTSIGLVVLMLAGGLAARVGAEDGSYRETVQFAEILSTILDYYVDPVEADKLLEGAYEGMLGGLDPNGAYLSPDEVAEWRKGVTNTAGPGLSVLKVGSSAQVVAIVPGSPASEADIEVGDRLRRIDGRSIRDLSLLQTRRLLQGEPGTTVRLDLLRPGGDFEPLEVSVQRSISHDAGYALSVEEGVAVLRLSALAAIDREALLEELDDVRSRGVEQLLLDLRNASEQGPRDIVALVGCFGSSSTLRLRDAHGRVVDSIEPGANCNAWSGEIAVLVNGATAGAAEALAFMARAANAPVFGQSTYGLGAEPKLYVLENGAGLLVSAAKWELPDGSTWNETGVEPDTVVEGEGEDYAQIRADQLKKVLTELGERAKREEEKAA